MTLSDKHKQLGIKNKQRGGYLLKYSVGDVVLVKEFRSGFMADGMDKYLNKAVTISSIREMNIPGFKQLFYKIKEDNGRYNWNDEMIVRKIEIDDSVNLGNLDIGDIEAIDVIELWGLDYHTGNALSHIYKMEKSEDQKAEIEQAIWYLKRKLLELNKLEEDSLAY